MKSKAIVAAALVLLGFAANAAMAQQRVNVPITNKEWEQPFPGFRIAGNTYYVGTYDLGCYLIDTSAGLILVNSGAPGSYPLIKANIEALGFKTSDIKIITATHGHFDHVGEISTETERRIRDMRRDGVQFLNQTVLLAKVNDDAEILARTFAKCHEMGVRPYYLFQGRPVKGASHFQVPLCDGIRIARCVNERLSGIQKTHKYIMSHYTGKIEILDMGEDGRVYMRYHQNKDPGKIGRIFSRPYVDGACWLDDMPNA